jgi:chromosome segregation ATPase
LVSKQMDEDLDLNLYEVWGNQQKLKGFEPARGYAAVLEGSRPSALGSRNGYNQPQQHYLVKYGPSPAKPAVKPAVKRPVVPKLALDVGLKNLAKQIDICKADASNCRDEVKGLMKTRDELLKQVEHVQSLERQIKLREEQWGEARRVLGREIKDLGREIKDLKQEKATLTQRLQGARSQQEYEQLEQRLHQVQLDLAHATAQKAASDRRVQELEANITQLQQQLAEAQRRGADAGQIAQLQEELRAQKELFKQEEQTFNENKRQNEYITNVANQRQGQLLELQDRFVQLQGIEANLRRELETAKQHGADAGQIAQLQEHLRKCQSEKEALEVRYKELVEGTKDIIERQRQKCAQQRDVDRNNIKKLQLEKDSLEHRLGELTQIKDGLQKRLEEADRRGADAGEIAKFQELLRLCNEEKKQLQDRLDGLQQQYDQKVEGHKTLNAELTKLKGEFDLLSEKEVQERKYRHRYQKEASDLKKEKAALEQGKLQAEAELQQLRVQAADYKRQYDEGQISNRELEKRLAQLQREFAEVDAARARLKEESADKGRRMSEMEQAFKAERMKLNGKIQFEQQEAKRRVGEEKAIKVKVVNELETKVAQLTSEIEKLRAEYGQAVAKLQADLEQARSNCAECKEGLKRCELENGVLRRNISEMEDQQTKYSQMEEHLRKLQDSNLKFQQLQSEHNKLKESLQNSTEQNFTFLAENRRMKQNLAILNQDLEKIINERVLLQQQVDEYKDLIRRVNSTLEEAQRDQQSALFAANHPFQSVWTQLKEKLRK